MPGFRSSPVQRIPRGWESRAIRIGLQENLEARKRRLEHASRSPCVQPTALKFFRSLMRPRKQLPSILQETDKKSTLRQEAADVDADMFGTEELRQLSQDMIEVMRKAPGVGLAAPQIGLSLKVIVLEDKEAYMTTQTERLRETLQRQPFGPIVICNPKLKPVGQQGYRYWEGCLSVAGYQGLVERYLTVDVTGFDVEGKQVKMQATGWQARILQHELDHLHGILYVDRAVKGSVLKDRPRDGLNVSMGTCTCLHKLP